MNLFTRLSDLLSENAAALFEDGLPEAIGAQVLREMTALVDRARAHAASVFAVERRLARELEWNRAQARRWHGLAADRPQRADRALRCARAYDDRVRELEGHYPAALLNSETVRTGLYDLETRLARARAEQGLASTAGPTEGEYFADLQRQFADLEMEWLGRPQDRPG